jgi:hypothetical protein
MSEGREMLREVGGLLRGDLGLDGTNCHRVTARKFLKHIERVWHCASHAQDFERFDNSGRNRKRSLRNPPGVPSSAIRETVRSRMP